MDQNQFFVPKAPYCPPETIWASVELSGLLTGSFSDGEEIVAPKSFGGEYGDGNQWEVWQ